MDKKKNTKSPAVRAQLALGVQIRDLRKSRGMTLVDLTERINRSVGWLSQIERGMSEVSISAMHEIAQALDVTVSWFFQEGTQAKPGEAGLIVRKSTRKKFDFHGTGVHEEMLSPSLSGQILLIESTFAPGTGTGDRGRKRQGEEAGLVLSGVLELHLEGEKFILQEGDSFALPGERQGSDYVIGCWLRVPSGLCLLVKQDAVD